MTTRLDKKINMEEIYRYYGNLQWLQTADSIQRRDFSSPERKQRAACCATRGNPSYAPGDQFSWYNTGSVIHGDGVKRSEHDSNQTDRDGSGDEGRY